jgi:hypothetical protein
MLEETAMTTRSVSMHRLFLLFGAALLVGSQLPSGALAQQYLGKARQNCVGVVGVKTPRSVVNVQPFQAVTAETESDQVTVSCEGEQQPVTIKCPDATDRVVIDRTQGSKIYSIICLKK